MAVKPLRSATRVLAVLEAVAAHQPVGLTAVTRLLDEDKSAVQRALATLAEDGWIRPAAGDPPRWELTTRTLVMAAQATSRVGLRQQARPVMEALRDRTDESVLLAVPDPPRVVTLDVVESRQLVRAAPHVGWVLPNSGSAASQALFAHLPEEELVEYLGAPPDEALRATLATVRERGWAVNHGDVTESASGIAAPILGAGGRAIAAIAVSAPSARLPKSVHAAVGKLVAEGAAHLSVA
jgi:IclR family acetate operon transcriptional repressor